MLQTESNLMKRRLLGAVQIEELHHWTIIIIKIIIIIIRLIEIYFKSRK